MYYSHSHIHAHSHTYTHAYTHTCMQVDILRCVDESQLNFELTIFYIPIEIQSGAVKKWVQSKRVGERVGRWKKGERMIERVGK